MVVVGGTVVVVVVVVVEEVVVVGCEVTVIVAARSLFSGKLSLI
ncbi:unannotated protein [freshwater metagenome]|uniref:Unannotated protein n=1 Tax=freshwater metagenome TaxID=449393 RepID=A0A6J6WMK5_9ZZZZ